MFADVWEWNQKVTVEVLVDGKVVSGSAVSHVWWQEANALGVSPSGYKGEATVVDLGRRGQLFALIGEETNYIAQYTLHDDLGYDRGDYERLLPAIMRFRGTKDVPRDRYPLLVTFTDPNEGGPERSFRDLWSRDFFKPGYARNYRRSNDKRKSRNIAPLAELAA